MKFIKLLKITAILALGSWFSLGIASAAEKHDLLSTNNDWSALKYTENGKPVCYIKSEPKTAKGNYTRRGPIYAIVTHRPSEKRYGIFSYYTGYTYQSNSTISLKIDGKEFTLYSYGEWAFAEDADDSKIVDALKRGNTMTVVGTSSRGTVTTDTFSLSGVTAAHNRISQECR